MWVAKSERSGGILVFRCFGIGSSQIMFWWYFLVLVGGLKSRVAEQNFFRAKAQRSHASGNDTCERCYPLGGTLMVTFPTTFALGENP
jgi:hypothetical protein